LFFVAGKWGFWEVERMIKGDGRFGSVWWRNLSSICEGLGLGGRNWFLYNLDSP